MSTARKVTRYSLDILETVLSIILLSPVYLILVFPVIAVCVLLRLVVLLYISIRYGRNKVSIMSVMDAAWAFETPASTSSVQVLHIVQGICDPSKVMARTDNIVCSEYIGGKLSRSIISVLGVPCWKRLESDKMNMQDYCQVVLDDQEHGPVTEDEMFTFLSSKGVHITSGDKAPWNILIIPSLNLNNTQGGGPYYAVVFQINHAIMDGLSLGNTFNSVLADKPFTFIIDPCTFPRPHFLQTLLIYTLGVLSIPRTVIRTSLFNDRYFKGGTAPELTGPKTLTWSRPIRLEALKQIKTATNTALISIVLSTVGAGLKILHNKNGETSVPAKFHALVTVPMLPYPKNRKPCNRASAIIAPSKMPSSTDTPTTSLRVNHHLLVDTGRYSSKVLAAANSFHPKLTGYLPLPMHRPLGLPLHLRLTLTSLPGPKEDIFVFGGDKVVDITFWIPIKYKIGLGVGAYSYKDKLRVSFIGDKVYYPHDRDIQQLAVAFEQQLQELGDFVGVPNVFL